MENWWKMMKIDWKLMENDGKLMEIDGNWWKLMEIDWNWWKIDGKLMEIDWKLIGNWLEIDLKLMEFPSIFINFHQFVPSFSNQFPINSHRFPSIFFHHFPSISNDFKSISIEIGVLCCFSPSLDFTHVLHLVSILFCDISLNPDFSRYFNLAWSQKKKSQKVKMTKNVTFKNH